MFKHSRDTVAARRPVWPFVLALLAGTMAACGRRAEPPPPAGAATPVYNKQTGRLEQLLSDKNGDGKVDTRAHMDGARLQMIEIDLNGDERPDRWEYYVPKTGAASQPGASEIERVEESAGQNGRITRREFYVDGVIARTEEDTDLDDRIDKWEQYQAGQLARVDLDLKGQGFASRRLVYRAGGSFDHVEEDSDGDGKFVPVTPSKKGGETR